MFLLISNFDKQDKEQLLGKFKNILYIHVRFRATLNFENFKVALYPMDRIFLRFAKSCILSCFIREKIHRAVFEI